jgi:hypothetical protein
VVQEIISVMPEDLYRKLLSLISSRIPAMITHQHANFPLQALISAAKTKKDVSLSESHDHLEFFGLIVIIS